MTNSWVNSKQLDLRGTPCPRNYVRVRIALESLSNQDILEVILDSGEPESMVISGLEESGYKVEILEIQNNWLRIKILPDDDQRN